MSHELEIVNGVAKMAYAGEKPWHGLGKEVPSDLSPEQMLKAADLDWEVKKVPAFITIDGKKVRIPWNGLVRESDNSILSTVSDDWKPVQNVDAFAFFDEYCKAGDMQMNTAGSLYNGQIVWGLAKINDGFTILKGDHVEAYMLFVNPHQWARSTEIRFTPTRVVCNNTLQLALQDRQMKSALSGRGVVKVSHKRVFDPARVKEMLGIAHMKMDNYKERAVFLASKRFTDESLVEYFKNVFPVYQVNKEKPSEKEMSKNASKALSIVNIQPGAKFAPGSWWQAFNACTFMVDHEIGRTPDSRVHSAWFGNGQKTKILALNKAVEYAQAA